MNLHLIPSEKFTESFLELVEGYLGSKNNKVYIYNYGLDFAFKQRENVTFIDNFSKIDLDLLEKQDKIFVHGFDYFPLILFLYKNRFKFKHNQLVLIAWGGDIYDSRYLLMDHGIHLRTRIFEYLKKKVISRCNVFMTFAYADMEIIKKYYKGQGVQFDCLYPSNADIKLLDNLRMNPKKSNIVRILLGNSATVTNKHIEAFGYLKHYADKNIEIICPLSYGNNDYRQEVITEGKRIFGDKFIPILNYMSPEEYSELLNSVNIAVFNHNRQQGTGNIEILAYLEKKLFICSDTTTWQHYVVRDKCRFFDTKKIQGMSFEDFCFFDNNDKTTNVMYFKKIWDINYIKSKWDNVLSYN